MALRLAFTQPDMGERRIGKHAIWDQPVARAATSSAQVVPDNPKIVLRHVRELRAAGAFPERPYSGRRCFQAVIDTDVASTVHLHTCLLETDAGGVGNAPRRDQDIAPLDFSFA